MSPPTIRIVQADYSDPTDARAVVEVLNAYASDPAGGGEALSAFARQHLVAELARRPQAFSVLAWDGELAVGLVNAIEGFSTFKCRPLVNVHDVAVLASHRGHRIAERMLAKVESLARERGACKLTLEVLSGNRPALNLYHRIGFEDYQLDPSLGEARFMQKWLA